MKWSKLKERSLPKNQSMNSHLERTNYYFLGYERDIEDIKNLKKKTNLKSCEFEELREIVERGY
tara:strand:- start:1485 stop:1676 length:192 start_codon:yes stop_codon:yes gene_type:complete